MTFRGGNYVTRMGSGRPGDDGPLADWWLYEDLQWPHTRLGACAGFAPEDVQVVPDDLRRDASRLLPARRPASTTWTSTGSRRRCASRRSRASAARRSSRPTTRTSRCCACRRTTTGWSRSGARDPADGSVPLCLDPAVGSGARGRRRCGATRRAACARSCFSELPGNLGLPSVHDPGPPLGSVRRRVRRDRHRHLHAQRVGVEDAVDVRRRAAGGLVDADPRARRGLAGRLAVLGAARALPERDAHLLRGPDRLDPLHPRPGRPGLGAQPRLERLARPGAGAAQHVLLGPDLRLLLRRRRRPRRHRRASVPTR